LMAGGGESEEQTGIPAWIVDYISSADPVDSASADRFVAIVGQLAGWSADRLSSKEKSDLVDALSDPELEYASSAGVGAAQDAVATLTEE